ncbi:MAG TPA: hypothetical protein VLC92_15945 [Rhodocyclaceae bacterium]|nr:hypothetical protein [Rhodocyclaceae bacterium]
MLKIEKFVGDKHETTISVPGFVASVCSVLLPESAHVALASHGIKLREVAEARRNGAPYSASVAVSERGVNKRVVISLT